MFLFAKLLSESENSITLLTEQNRLLKEEIRRMQRSVDRCDIANNLEYLKNVLMKVISFMIALLLSNHAHLY